MRQAIASVPVVTLATAHPAKFPQAIKSAGLDNVVSLPLHLKDLFERPERFEVLHPQVVDFVPALLRREHEGERGVRMAVDRGDGVHHKRDAH